MHKKKLAGIILFSIGCGMLMAIIIPQFIWCVFAAITLIVLGFIFWRYEPKKECDDHDHHEHHDHDHHDHHEGKK